MAQFASRLSDTNTSDALRAELLKLSTLLLEGMGRDLLERRKELITFGWQHLKGSDTALLVRHWAYVNVCRFVAVYETPPKIILQVRHIITLTLHCPPLQCPHSLPDPHSLCVCM